MDLTTRLAQRFLIPFFERRWGIHDDGLLGRLSQSQFQSLDAQRDRQWERAHDLVRFAAEHNPFYRQRFAGIGFQPEDLRGWDDLAALPLLTKDDIREHSDTLISDGFASEQMFPKRTGGSTGVPVHLFWDREAHLHKQVAVKRHDAWAGYRFGMKRAALWGDTDKAYPLKWRLYRALCERTIYLDTLRMNEASMAHFVAELRRFRPTILTGHAHSIYFLADYLIQEGVDDIGFDGIISTAETLVPAEREVIEGRFGRVLFDRYGCEELSLIASECEAHDGLHTSAEGLYVEVLGGDATTPGRVVVTDLTNRGMPFLRYEVGDLATVAEGDCACGRGLPRLGRVSGRTTDILYAPDGSQISGVSILDTFVIHIAGVRQAQIVQDTLDHLRLRVVPDRGYSESTEQELAAMVAQVFGPAMRFDLERVEALAPTERGKFQFTICEVDPSQIPSRR